MLVEGNRGFYFGSQAFLVEEDRELAWAEKHVVRNPALKYVLGRYVEADRANQNGHIFDYKELGAAQAGIPNSPLNMLHRAHYIVGNFIASELMHPTQAGSEQAEEPFNPYVEALAAFYRYYYPNEFIEVEKAHKEGSLFFSMECVPKTVSCVSVCGKEFAYDGRLSDTYCEHLNQPGTPKRLGQPHFTGGALIIPPERPGWRRAAVTEVSALIASHVAEADRAYKELSEQTPHLDARQWESAVIQLMVMAYADEEGEWSREFSPEQRKQLATKGHALPDGSYPIATPEDLANAIKAFGRANPSKRPQVRAHIKKRAAALGKTSMVPQDL